MLDSDFILNSIKLRINEALDNNKTIAKTDIFPIDEYSEKIFYEVAEELRKENYNLACIVDHRGGTVFYTATWENV